MFMYKKKYIIITNIVTIEELSFCFGHISSMLF